MKPETLNRWYMQTFVIGFSMVCGIFSERVDGWQQEKSEPAKKKESSAIRVMSFNIRFGTARDGKNHWKNRHDLVIKTIEEFNPDLLGTQEVLDFQAEFLKKKLTDYEYIGRSRDKDPSKGEQCGILFRKKRFEKIESGQFWLSETPDRVGSKSWDSSLPRIATWVTLKDKSNGGRELVFLNTHFDHRGRKARLESAKTIRQWITKNHSKSALVITGDFNCAISSKPYEVFLDEKKEPKLIDTYRAKHRDTKDTGTFNGFKGTKTGARIDWVLHTAQFSTQSASINRFQKEGRYPSDHFPVTSVLSWKK